MIRSIAKIIKSMWSKRQLMDLYESRRLSVAGIKRRSHIAVGLTFVLLLSAFAFLVHLAWSRQDTDSYIKSRKDIVVLEKGSSAWLISDVVASSCPDRNSCLSDLSKHASFRARDLYQYQPAFPSAKAEEKHYVLVQTEIERLPLSDLSNDINTFVLSFPTFSYSSAELFIDREGEKSFFGSEEIFFNFGRSESWSKEWLTIQILFEVNPTQEFFVLASDQARNIIQRNVVLMSRSAWNSYQEFAILDKAGRGDFVGSIARIIMAVFILLLFLIVDSSPETLGLSLFMGFEALAMTLSYGWLPVENAEFIRHYSYQMGDIFRLYFFLQITRMVRSNLLPWLFWGSLLSIPYGLARYDLTWFQSLVHLELSWITSLSRYRDAFVGIVGTLLCARSFLHLRNSRLPWRQAALVVACLGAFEQVLDPIVYFIPTIHATEWFKTVTDVYQPLSAWLLAFSVFLNISTLENRVRTLSTIETQAKEIKQEMELGRTVQKSFLKVPVLDPKMQVACHHEAMTYVSGDTYFVHFNSSRDKLTLLINDVTGHGVQAALKASGVSVIASSIWEHDADNKSVTKHGHVFNDYASRVSKFYNQIDEQQDILAVGAAEFSPKDNMLNLFRVNFPFPIIIEPKLVHHDGEESRKSDRWRIQVVPTHSNQILNVKLNDYSFLVLTSDGFLDTSRKTVDFLRYLRKHLASATYDLNCQAIKDIFINCNIFPDVKHHDDRTFIVFQWRPGEAVQQSPTEWLERQKEQLTASESSDYKISA